MRRSSDSKQSSQQQQHSISKSPIDWELRPGGMVVQKREEDDGDKGPTINIKVHHGTSQHQLIVHPQSTFGELKRVLAHMTGLEPPEQRVLFRGKEKDDVELLHMAGVKDTSKLVLLEDPASRERKLEQMNKGQGISDSKACEAVVLVRSDVDKLVDKIAALESAVNGGAKVEEKAFLMLTESLMVQLLKLDGIEAEGEAKAQRKLEVRRVQSFVDKVDALKARNSNPFSSNSTNVVAVTTQWETFESGAGSLSAPPAMTSSTTVITNDWEHFD